MREYGSSPFETIWNIKLNQNMWIISQCKILDKILQQDDIESAVTEKDE